MPPDDEKMRLTRQWLCKAAHDLLMAERAVTGLPPLRDMAVFHCQQAVEKALKGFLTWHDQSFRRTHDLLRLVEQCQYLDSAFVHLQDTARLLTPYVAEFRYPDDVDEPTPEDTDTALRLARQVCSLVLDRLPLEVRP